LKVAFVARGDLFAASVKDAGDATRITSTAAIESQPVWAPDSRRLAYVSSSSGGQRLFLHDFASNAGKPLTPAGAVDLSPAFSPDGKQLAFLRNRKELRVMDLAAGTDRVVASGVFADSIDSPEPVWSPDGRWIALFAIGAKRFTNVEVVPASGGVTRPVSFLANAYANSIAWSPDGTYILYATRQRTEDGQLARVDLVPRTPKFREDLFRDLFAEPKKNPDPNPKTEPEPANPEPKNPGTPEPRNPGTRLCRYPRPPLLRPRRPRREQRHHQPRWQDGLVVASTAGQSNLYAYALDELATDRPVARQVTTTSGGKADVQFTKDSKEVVYLDAGRIQIANLERRDARAISVTAELTVDFSAERQTIFDQAWTLLRDNFFDAAFNGVNWEASRERYGQRAAGAATPDEFRRIVSLMIGDLNASHLGISAAGAASAIGRLGLEFDRREFETRDSCA
jgi:dipeptidyl aminopeptidase/acylaminoacyl peptidase